MNSTIMSNKQLRYQKKIYPHDAAAIICSSYPIDGERYNWLKVALLLEFDDITNDNSARAFTMDIADRIRVFVAENENRPLYICCDSGESRSAAIVAAINRAYGLDDLAIWSNPKYHPNPLVYKLQCEAFGIVVDEIEIKDRTETNENALHNAIAAARGRSAGG